MPDIYVLKSRIVSSVLIASSLFLFVFILSTGEIYFNNSGEFNFLYPEVFFYLITTCLLLVLLTTLILLIIPDKLYRIISSVFIGLVLISWVEANFLYPNLGPLDGRIIDWNKWFVWGYIDIIIWITVLTAFVYIKYHIFKYLNILCLFIILIITGSTLYNYFNYSSKYHSEYVFDENGIADFSAKQNIIVIILDETQSDVFYELLQENPVMNKVFSGFTYYPDTVAGFDFTIPSIPAILTGQYYDNSQPFTEYVKNAYSESSITKYLIENNYRVDLYPKFVDFNYYKSKTIADNLIKKGAITDFDRGMDISSNLIKLALFKISPHILRNYIYSNYLNQASEHKKKKHTLLHIEPLYQDIEFVRKLESDSRIVYKVPTFKFFHLRGSHIPWMYDANGNVLKAEEITESRKNYKDHMLHTLKLTSDILLKFHEIEIYDSSLIYILSDHGTGLSPGTIVNAKSRLNDIDNTEKFGIPNKVRARAIPLFMKKMPFSKGGLNISDIPISTTEFPNILKNDLELKTGEFEHRVNDGNSRKYLYYDPFKHRRKNNYLPPMFEFEIKGDSWLDSSWKGPNKVHTYLGNYNNLFSMEFNKYPKCINSRNEEIQNESFNFFSDNKNEYILNVKEKLNNEILLVVAFSYSEEINNMKIDISLNDRKIGTLESGSSENIIDWPYNLVYINKKLINTSANNKIKLRVSGAPGQCIKDKIDSLHLLEFQN